MRIRRRGARNERAVQEQIARGGNVIARFIPEIRKAEKGRMQQHQAGKKEREEKDLLRPGGGCWLRFCFHVRQCISERVHRERADRV